MILGSIEAEIITKMIVAAILGLAVGLEREWHNKPAGIRTHALVCVGAAIFTVVSIYFTGTEDPSRIASGIVTGIGFLGAGMIFHSKDIVRGLTTAAELWCLAGIGIAVGIGMYMVSFVATVIVLTILVVGRLFEIRVMKTLEERKRRRR